jgi:endonuclease/exonuclease/phosphatase family metal-dependent hydrolase
MTFNIRTKTFIDGLNGWNHRKDIVFDVLSDNAPDVFGLQEARYSQYRAIRQALPQYGAYAAGRKNGKASGESCPIFYRRDRFTLADAGTFWFSNTPSVPGSKDWGNMPPRICSWTRLVERQTGTSFYVYNLHLDHLSQNSRDKSVRLLTEKIKLRKTKDPFIVMGDFNMRLDNPAMRYLDRIGHNNAYVKSYDTWQLIHPGRRIGTRHGFDGSLDGPQIDHIRISSNLQALDARIDHRHDGNGRYPSDHFPLIARIMLAPSAGRGYAAATENIKTNSETKQLPDV